MTRTKPPNSGRKPGTPNKVTQEAREAIAAFVDGNSHRLQEWLDLIATGKDADGNKTLEPNPAKAFELFQSVIEYHVPKLSRSDVNANVNVYEALVINKSDG